MRSCVALQTCLALLLALLLAPFQHIHTGPDHDHDGVVHAHFYSIPALPAAGPGPHLIDPDDDHASARSLDTFTLVMGSSLAPFMLSRGPDLRFVPSQAFPPNRVVEERGNSPPARDRSVPRAPPC